MKTSNKLILFFCILVLGVTVAAHLSLYSKFSRGEIHTEYEFQENRFNRIRVAPAKWLSFKGHLRVMMIPSDSFRILLEKEVPGLDCRQEGDSLIISGNLEGEKNPHGYWGDYWQLPRVYIFGSYPKGIRIEDGFLSLSNEKEQPGLSACLAMKNAQCWIGALHPENDSISRTEPFDSLVVEETNSTLVINRQSKVHAIAVRMDSVSEIIDRFSLIDTADISAEKSSKIYMTGFNFNKVALYLPMNPQNHSNAINH